MWEKDSEWWEWRGKRVDRDGERTGTEGADYVIYMTGVLIIRTHASVKTHLTVFVCIYVHMQTHMHIKFKHTHTQRHRLFKTNIPRLQKKQHPPLKDIFKAKYSQELSLKLIGLFLSNHWLNVTSLIPSVIIGSGMFLEGSHTLLVTLLGAEARLGEACHQRCAFEGIFLLPTP